MDEIEDDDHSHSPPQPPPPQPPQQQPGHVTVTVAAAPPPPSSQSPLPVGLPIQQLSSRIPTAIPTSFSGGNGGAIGGGIGGGGGREDCWSEGATSVLIDAWGERYMELSRGNLKQKHWKEVADIVSSRDDYTKLPKTDIQCKNRIDTVKKKYKVEKARVSSGNGPSRWPFFERLDRLIGPAASVATPSPNSNVKGLGFATVSPSNGGPSSSGKTVPVGIPVGVRPLPLPFSPHYLQTPPHLPSPPQLPPQQQQLSMVPHKWGPEQQRQQQQLRHNFNFSTPPSGVPQLRYTPVNYNANASIRSNNNSNSNDNSGGNVNNIGGLRQAQQRPHQQQFRMYPAMPDSDSEQEAMSNDSGDSLPPKRRELDDRKRPRILMEAGFGGGREGGVKGKKKMKSKGKEKKGGSNGAAMRKWGNSVRDLTMAILKFGEAYEAAESKKLQHIKEMELQRMKFSKELELQRMKFMMKTQLELSQLNDNGNGNGNSNGNSDSRGGGSGGVGGGESNHHHEHHPNHQIHHNHIHENHINHHANSDSSN